MSDQLKEICVPDIGGATDVDVIEVQISVGDTIAIDDSIVTLEGDKASMDIPATAAGVVESIAVSVGDKVSEGSVLCAVKEAKETASSEDDNKKANAESKPEKPAPAKPAEKDTSANAKTAPASTKSGQSVEVHAGPAVRRLAKELDINLSQVSGSGEKGRITKEDIKRFMSGGSTGGFALPKAPAIDFSKFGEVETQPLSKIKKLSGANLHRNWVSIPHVTQFGEADITDMEVFRQGHKEAAAKKGYKLTPLVFIMKAVVAALKAFPHFNASLDASGESLVMKKYC